MKNVWRELPKPIVCLAPMEGVTDTVFRRVVVRAGRPDLMFGEFCNVEGLFGGNQESVVPPIRRAGGSQNSGNNSNEITDSEEEGMIDGVREVALGLGLVPGKGFRSVAERLVFTQIEKPLIAQIWGMKPDNFYKAAKLCLAMEYDGVDINMGCPDKRVIKMGACSALVNNRELAAEMIAATKKGLSGKIPVSVKIRIGFGKIVTEDWAEFLLKQGIDALIVHGRTTKQMSKVPADWGEIGKAVVVRDRMGAKTLIIGNGDVESLDEAREKVRNYGVDGVMIGRGIFKDPWVFGERVEGRGEGVEDRLGLLMYHVRLFDKVWGERKNFDILKRFFKIYVQGFAGAAGLRGRLMKTNNIMDVEEVLRVGVDGED